MKSANKPIFKTAMFSAILTLMSVTANAALTVQEGGRGKIVMGGADSLANAKAIMYANSDTSGNGYANRSYYVDNGYTTRPATATTPTTYSNTGYNNTGGFNEEGDDYNPSWSSASRPSYTDSGYSAGSRGVMVMDAQTGQVLYEKNADVARPIASLSKLMTAVIVAESNLDMNETITISPLDFKTPKKSGSDRLRVGDQLNRAEVLLMMLMKSENPAAKALARTDPQGYDAFIAKMNRKARELGMTQTQYYDPSGLDSRNVASPRDLAILAKYAAQHNIISRFSTTPSREFWVNNINSGSRTISAKSTNYMVRDGLYNLVLSKTGYISEAGKCLIVETNVNNRPAVVVLLGATDTKTRWNDAENILTTLRSRV